MRILFCCLTFQPLWQPRLPGKCTLELDISTSSLFTWVDGIFSLSGQIPVLSSCSDTLSLKKLYSSGIKIKRRKRFAVTAPEYKTRFCCLLASNIAFNKSPYSSTIFFSFVQSSVMQWSFPRWWKSSKLHCLIWELCGCCALDMCLVRWNF